VRVQPANRAARQPVRARIDIAINFQRACNLAPPALAYILPHEDSFNEE